MKHRSLSFLVFILLGLLAVVSFFLLVLLRGERGWNPMATVSRDAPTSGQLQDFVSGAWGFDCVRTSIPDTREKTMHEMPEGLYDEARQAGYLMDNNETLSSGEVKRGWDRKNVLAESCKDDYGRKVALFQQYDVFMGSAEMDYFILVQEKDGSMKRYDVPSLGKADPGPGNMGYCTMYLSGEFGHYQGRRFAHLSCGINPSLDENPYEGFLLDMVTGEIAHTFTCTPEDYGLMTWKGERLINVQSVPARSCTSTHKDFSLSKRKS
jgi:hypothetical protein